MSASFLSIQSISKSYNEDGRSVLSDFSLEIKRGERVGIVGETGSGKSTLLKVIGGMIQSDTGEVFLEREKKLGPHEKLIAGHDDIVYLSQHFELPKFLTVGEYLEDAYLIAPAEAELVYKACQVFHLLDKDTRFLSGGEKQRIALAKLLLKKPKVLLLDEPFSNLDSLHKRAIRQVIENVEKELSTTVVLVAHDPIDVLSWADRILVLRKGKVVQEGSSKKLYYQPVDRYVAGLFGEFNLLDSSTWGLVSIENYSVLEEKVFVRPEDIEIGDSGLVKGEVVSLRFSGPYYKVVVQMADDQVVIYSSREGLKEGQRVGLSLRNRLR